MPTTTRQPKAAPTVRVQSDGRVLVESHSRPIVPEATLHTSVRIGRRTFHAEYSVFTSTTPNRYFFLDLERGGHDSKVELVGFDAGVDFTIDDVRALAVALEAIASEAEREMPALITDAERVTKDLRNLGLDIP